ncbi:hypothetical protein LBMAG37_09430 [Anaerolineae bacterium]|nr:hypothetical protein LBMAG37_09430 [Anaerolineae bacterium]
MKILVVGPHWRAGWTESTRDALLALGCEVQVFYYNQTASRQAAARTRTRLLQKLSGVALQTPNLVRQLLWILTGGQLHTQLMYAVRAARPELVLVLKGETILPATLRAIKRPANAPLLAAWYYDNPFVFNDRDPYWLVPSGLPTFDRSFVFDRGYFPQLQARGARKISFLPAACDPALFHPEPPELVRSSRLASSICFIGTFSPARGVMLESLAGIDNIAIWGPGWQPTLKQLRGKLAHNIFRGEGLPPGQVSHAYQSAPIVVNTHGPQTKLGGLNMRAFEVPACGAFQLMDYVPEMEALLQPGHDVAVYRTPQEAGTLAREYLADPEARQRIARQGHARVLAEHTYRHRMQTLLAAL